MLMADLIYWEHRHDVAQLLKIRRRWTFMDDVSLSTIKTSGWSFIDTVDRTMVVSSIYFALTKIPMCVCPLVSIILRCGVADWLRMELVSMCCRWSIPGSDRRVPMKFGALISSMIRVIVVFVRVFVNGMRRFDCCGDCWR